MGAAAIGAALLFSVLPAAATSGSAPQLKQLTGPVEGTASAAVADGTCPVNPGFPDPEKHRHVEGTVGGRNGTRLVVDLCEVFEGAMGGIRVEGTFTMRRPSGTAAGTVAGAIAFQAKDRLNATLHITSATNGLRRTQGGELTLTGCLPSQGPIQRGKVTLTPPAFAPCTE